MASRIAEAYVQIVPRIDGIGSSLTKGISGEMGLAGEQGGSGFANGFKKVLGPALAAISVVGVARLTKELIFAGEAAATQNNRITQIATSMGLFGDQADNVAKELIRQAEAQAILTGEDQNAIKTQQAKLLTFSAVAQSAGQIGGVFERATQAGIDLAAAGFGTVENNAVQLGKALQDPITGLSALRRAGVTFTEAEKEKIRVLVESGELTSAQTMILDALESQVGGVAAATRNMSDRLKTAGSIVKERFGATLLPVFDSIGEVILDKVIPAALEFADKLPAFFSSTGDKMGSIFAPIKELFSSLGPVFTSLAPQIMQFISAISPVGLLLKALMPVIPIIIEFVTELATAFAGILTEALKLIIESMTTLLQAVLPVVIDLFKTLMPAIQSLAPVVIKLVQAFLPLIPALLTIALAIVPLLEVLLPPLISLLGIIIPVVAKLAEVLGVVLTVAIGVLVGAFSGLVQFLPALTGAFSSVFKGIANFVIEYANVVIQSIEGMVNFVISGVNLMIDALNKLKFEVPDWVPVIGGGKFGFNLQRIAKIAIGRLPALADGGFVNKPTTALIGEAGPEVVIPLNRFEEMMGLDGSGQGKTINYYAAPNNSLDAEQALFQAIQRSKVVTGW